MRERRVAGCLTKACSRLFDEGELSLRKTAGLPQHFNQTISATNIFATLQDHLNLFDCDKTFDSNVTLRAFIEV
jgi:hypothetical protein